MREVCSKGNEPGKVNHYLIVGDINYRNTLKKILTKLVVTLDSMNSHALQTNQIITTSFLTNEPNNGYIS